MNFVEIHHIHHRLPGSAPWASLRRKKGRRCSAAAAAVVRRRPSKMHAGQVPEAAAAAVLAGGRRTPPESFAFSSGRSAGTGDFRCDWRTGETEFSPSYRALIGAEPVPVVAANSAAFDPYDETGDWAEAIHPEDRTRVLICRMQLEIGERERGCIAYRVRHADGAYRSVRVEMWVERTPDGRPGCLRGRAEFLTSPPFPLSPRPPLQ